MIRPSHLVLVLAGVACSIPETSVPELGWDHDLTPIVFEYKQDMEARGVVLQPLGTLVSVVRSAGYVNDCGRDLAGCCYWEGGGRTRRAGVFIQPGYSDEYTKAIMYHELTHCLVYPDPDHMDVEGHIMSETVDYRGRWETAVDTLANYIRSKETE